MKLARTLGLGALVSGVAVEAGLSDGVTNYWNLDEQSGTRVATVGGINLTQTFGSTGYAAGMSGNAATFSVAAGSRLDAANSALHDLGGDRTFALWLQFSLGTTQRMILDRRGGGGSSTYSLYVNATETVSWFINDYDPEEEGPVYSTVTTAVLTEDAWHLVIAQYNATTKKAGLSIDGGSMVEGDALGHGPLIQTAVLGVGARGTGGTPIVPFGGLLDEFLIWNRLLTAQEPAELFNAGAGTFYPFA